MKPTIFICLVTLAVAAAPLSSRAQAPSNVLLEACNAMKDSKKRLECLKAATTQAKPAAESTRAPVGTKPPAPEPLNVVRAASICERLMTGLAKKHDQAAEAPDSSSDSVLAVTWPADEGKTPVICQVNRATERISSVISNGTIISSARIAEMERDAGFRDEAKAGNFANFVKFAKDSLASEFKDPGSAQYRNLFVSGKALMVLCGEVNAKNSYGAYVGFRGFYATGVPSLNMVEPAREPFVFEKMYPSMCGEKVVDVPG